MSNIPLPSQGLYSSVSLMNEVVAVNHVILHGVEDAIMF